jgi:hypothetical protein
MFSILFILQNLGGRCLALGLIHILYIQLKLNFLDPLKTENQSYFT